MKYHVVIVCGVTASGKTTVARSLAEDLGWEFYDADDLHDAENIARMQAGVGLTDDLRHPWLLRVRDVIETSLVRREFAVVACSALKESYREILTGGLTGVRYVFLEVPADVLRERLRQRRGHFAGVSLLDSQLAALEIPADALRLDGTRPVAELLVDIRRDVAGQTR